MKSPGSRAPSPRPGRYIRAPSILAGYPLRPDGCRVYKIPANRTKAAPRAQLTVRGRTRRLNRRRVDRSPVRGAAFRRSRRSRASSSSSWAQSDDSHAIVTTPSRSATGAGRGRERRPATSGQADCTARGGSPARPRRARRARPPRGGAGPRRLTPRVPPRRRLDPAADLHADHLARRARRARARARWR